MGMLRSLSGFYCIEITSASPAQMLESVNNIGIVLFDVTAIDELRLRVNVKRMDIGRLKSLLTSRGEHIEIVKQWGIYWNLIGLLKRPVLLIGLTILAIIALYLPTRVLFITVEGNQTVPSKFIVEKALDCGIGFWASRREVRSEKVKNALLGEIPDLKWAGVNTIGCIAVISVQERSIPNEKNSTSGVSSVVAARDGIITEMTVLKGNPLCRVGQAVKQGQVLVSGYTDCGITIQANAADAEVMAQTMRTFTAVSQSVGVKRIGIADEKKTYQLRIGKNIINLCKDSGISDATCVKMYEEKILTLPGGFQLPVSLVKVHYQYYACETDTVYDSAEFSWMSKSADAYLNKDMLSGRILQRDETIELADGVCYLSGRYACLEMIGQIRSEEIIKGNGKRD